MTQHPDPVPPPSSTRQSTASTTASSTASTAAADVPPPSGPPLPVPPPAAPDDHRARRRPPLLSWTPAAVVFDCDGTLMDTERHWQEARDLTLREYDLSVPPGAAERWKGLHYTECGRLMAAESGRDDLGEALTDALLTHFRTLVAAEPTTMPGAPELVAHAATFAPLAVASNCPADVVETCLAGAGLLRHFDHVVVPTAAVRPKPAPDVYLTAVRLCGARPEESLAVEDSACGVESALRAGLRVMGVGPRPPDGIAASVDLWVPGLDDPEVYAWAARRLGRV